MTLGVKQWLCVGGRGPGEAPGQAGWRHLTPGQVGSGWDPVPNPGFEGAQPQPDAPTLLTDTELPPLLGPGFAF